MLGMLKKNKEIIEWYVKIRYMCLVCKTAINIYLFIEILPVSM